MAIIDTACAKTVAGMKWYEDYAQHAKTKGHTVRTIPERESFKFGPGKQIFSEFAVVIPVQVEGLAYCVRASVIKQDVPLLFSRKVLQGVGAVLDMENNRMEYGRLENKVVELHEVESGHVAIELGNPARFCAGYRRGEALCGGS